MSKESIRSMLEAHGTFPDEPEVLAGFDALFKLAEAGQETLEDLVYGFLMALDQWSHVDAIVDPALAARLRTWAMAQWRNDGDDERAAALCRVLVNVPSPAAKDFLSEQRRLTADADIVALLDRYIPQMDEEDEKDKN